MQRIINFIYVCMYDSDGTWYILITVFFCSNLYTVLNRDMDVVHVSLRQSSSMFASSTQLVSECLSVKWISVKLWNALRQIVGIVCALQLKATPS